MDLNALADLCMVVQYGGLGKASRQSGRAKSSLSRHLASLELELGLRLMERGARGLELTEAGQQLVARAEGPLLELAQALAEIKEGVARPRGTLRIAAPGLFSQIALGRLCAAFMAQYPEVRIDVTTEDRMTDLVEERIDVAIRVNPQPETDLVGHCFARDRMLVVAAPGLARPATGLSLPAVGLANKEAEHWSTGAGTTVFQPHYLARFSSILMVRDAVLAGAGAATLPESLVRSDLAAGRLQNWGDVDHGGVDLWVLHTSRRLARPKVRAFVDFIGTRYPGGEMVV